MGKKADGAPRALALDALRGLAILTMCLSGVVPWHGLPNWMYHAQFPRPEAVFNPNWPGYTWVDLVFPAFLFSMGAAFPFAVSNRLARGFRMPRIVGGVLLRGVLLALFAIYIQHTAPWQIENPPTTATWFLALFAFAILFPVYTRLPDGWPVNVKRTARGLGIAACVGLVAWIRRGEVSALAASEAGITADGLCKIFIGRYDIIILVLANMAVAGSLVWLVSRRSIALRLVLMFVIGLAAHAVFRGQADWLKPYVAVPWPLNYLVNFAYLKYMLVVIPGTIVGDLLLQWMRSGEGTGARRAWDRVHLRALAFLLFLIVIAVHIGLQGRWPLGTLYLLVASLVIMAPLVRGAVSAAERFLAALVRWGSAWLIIGLVIDARLLDMILPLGYELAESGIKKDPSTLSYYFVSTGLAIYLLASMTVWIDLLGRSRWFWLLISNGQNPMIAYVGIRNLLAPVVNLTGLDHLMFNKVFTAPWPRFVWSLTKTLGLAVVVGIFTRLRIVWRT